MTTSFPSGNEPYIFSDTLGTNSTDTSQANLDLHINAFNVVDFSAVVPANAATIFVTFVVFSYPDAANSSTTPPLVPIVEILDQTATFDGPGTALHLTPLGTDSLAIGKGQFVNYSYNDLGAGLFQIVFTPDNVSLETLKWNIRFTINDGLTTPDAQTGLTLAVDIADSRVSWIAVPGQLDLPTSGPIPIDFGAALAGIALSGARGPDSTQTVLANTTHRLVVPIGNYGTAPLSVTVIAPAGASNGFSAQLQQAEVMIPPGSVSAGAVEVSYAAPAAPDIRHPTQATKIALTCNDPFAAASGTTAHFNTLSIYASSHLPSITAITYIAFFDNLLMVHGSAAVFTALEQAWASGRYNRVLVSGFANTSATPSLDQALSVRRARAVQAELVTKLGAPASAIAIQGFGQTSPLLLTGSGEEPINNRVEITANFTIEGN